MSFTYSTKSRAEAREEGNVCSTAGQSVIGDVIGIGARGRKHHGSAAQSQQGSAVSQQHQQQPGQRLPVQLRADAGSTLW